MQDIDILDQMNAIDLSKVETSFPLLATGVVEAQIQECEFKRDTEKKGDDAKPYLFVKYALTQPWKTVPHDGAEAKNLNPGDRGMTVTESIYIGTYVDKNGDTKPYGVDRIALLRECVTGQKAAAGTGIKTVPDAVRGQVVLLKLKFDPAPRNNKTNEVYGPRTSVDGYVRRKAS